MQFKKMKKGQISALAQGLFVLGVLIVAFLLVTTSLDDTLTGSPLTAANNVTEMFVNVSTQLPTVGTILGVTILLFIIAAGIIKFASSRR